jgi:putative DNA primase/helicase
VKKKKTITPKSQALEYAGLDLPVIPLHGIKDGHCTCGSGPDCAHPGKHPRTPNGVKDATTDRKTIKAWWNRWPDANIGIATGRSPDMFVIDVDGDVGKAGLERLQAEHGRLRKTVTVRTGKGRHRYFRCDGARVGNYVGKLGRGIDVRGDGGYVVAAGSIHASGTKYRFLDGRGLDDIEIASAPEWHLGLVRKDSSNTTETEKVDPIPESKLDRARSYADVAVVVSWNGSPRRQCISGIAR